jgi:hypothetical protein
VVDGTASELCTVVGNDVSGVAPLGSGTTSLAIEMPPHLPFHDVQLISAVDTALLNNLLYRLCFLVHSFWCQQL